jgi:pimeloyl-ACP methyl ester carboxylesterase
MAMAVTFVVSVIAFAALLAYLYLWFFTSDDRYQSALRAFVTFGLLSAGGWLLALPNGGWWTITTVAAWIVLILGVLMVDGYIGDVWDALFRPPGPEVYVLGNKPDAPWVIYFPGANNGAEITSRHLRPALLQRYNVMAIEHPRRDFNYEEVIGLVFRAMAKCSVKNPSFIGHSFGGQIAISVMREYKRRGCPHGPIGRAAFVCVPVVSADIKAFLPISWSRYIKGGPLANRLIWWWAQPLFRMLSPKQRIASGVNPEWAKEHRRFMDRFPIRGFFAQLGEMHRHQAPQPNEFREVPALIIRTQGDDIFVRHEAVVRLQAAFPDHLVAELPGIHANLVEEAPAYTTTITAFL